MSIAGDVSRNVVTMFLTIVISIVLLVAFIIGIGWLIYSKVNIAGIPLSSIIGK